MSFRGHMVLVLIFAALSAVWSAPAQGKSKGRNVTLRQVVQYADRALVRHGQADSPLRRELTGIVKAARRESISPFLLLSIAGEESTFGRNRCGYNAWGWNSCRGYNFRSFSEGALTVATGLRINYLDKWHMRTVEAVGTAYCTGSSWAGNVLFFMDSYFRAGEGLQWADAVRTVSGRA